MSSIAPYANPVYVPPNGWVEVPLIATGLTETDDIVVTVSSQQFNENTQTWSWVPVAAFSGTAESTVVSFQTGSAAQGSNLGSNLRSVQGPTVTLTNPDTSPTDPNAPFPVNGPPFKVTFTPTYYVQGGGQPTAKPPVLYFCEWLDQTTSETGSFYLSVIPGNSATPPQDGCSYGEGFSWPYLVNPWP